MGKPSASSSQNATATASKISKADKKTKRDASLESSLSLPPPSDDEKDTQAGPSKAVAKQKRSSTKTSKVAESSASKSSRQTQ